MDERLPRKLAAILYADVAGYSQLTGLDEETTHKKLNASLNLLTSLISAHGGKAIHEAGDALLAEFQSVTSAVDAATDFQNQMAEMQTDESKDSQFEFRIGINLGEVIHDRGDIYGDGVNIAARIEGLAEPGGVCVSGTVYEQVKNKLDLKFEDLGYQKLKNIGDSVRIYALKLTNLPEKKVQGLFGDTIVDQVPLITGGCLCGEIRYEAEGEELGSAYCHCRMCQRFTGSPATVGTGIRKNLFRITQGKPKIYVSSKIAERAFCPTCGSSLWMTWPHAESRQDWIFVHTVSLDEPQKFPPNSHTGMESCLPWHDIHDHLPRTHCEESPQLVEAWEAAGVKISDYPRSVNVSN
ncbi:MAG: adenylate/guanylate cyclase domain-containing protein [Gammaproteobacteria bacterium]